jgi:hypothetical protein
VAEYLLLIYSQAWDYLDDETRDRIRGGHGLFQEKNGPAIRGGNALQPPATATTVHADGAVTDGPFAETKEALGGYYVVEANTLDEALDLARQLPLASSTSGVEVRPIQVMT